MEYQLELKQIVDFPRCRIYRDFFRTLMNDKDIRVNGESYLYYYTVLCSYANFRFSYRKLDGKAFLIGPGEWICRPTDLKEWFRTRFQHQALSILEHLKDQNYIRYSYLNQGKLIKFYIKGWRRHNTALDYNYPCLKDVGFFFFPIASAHELISTGKCSEMDIILDLWLHAIYNDDQVNGSEAGPVVYFRNLTGSPVLSYSDLSLRWNISKTSVSRIISKLRVKDYLTLISFSGKHGSVIYLNSYLSTMFSISDVMIDKEEVSMILRFPLDSLYEKPIPNDEQISVPENDVCVPKSHIKKAVKKTAEILATQGIPCCECPRTEYILSKLSDCNESKFKYMLRVRCPDLETSYLFELSLISSEPGTGRIPEKG